MKYALLKSWHIVKNGAEPGTRKTLCGRDVPAESMTMRHFPADEKSCESCFRVASR